MEIYNATIKVVFLCYKINFYKWASTRITNVIKVNGKMSLTPINNNK